MKELTAEEKAKRYDEILARAKGTNLPYYKDDIMSKVKEFIDYLLPELKESEDVGIRGAIIDYLKDNNLTEWAAWLEKQGEQKSTLPKWKYKKDHTPLLRDSLILNKYGCVAKSPSGAIVSDVWVIDYDELAKLPKEEFERQGEQILANSAETCKDEHKQWVHVDPISEEDKLQMMFDGQKPADKNEPKCVPKFHEGDWVISRLTENEPRQIAEITEEGYKTTYGGWIGFSFEKDMRLWTIQDAKDGDVISSGQIIILFKKWEDSDWNFVIAYAGIDVSGGLQITNGHWLLANDSHPATKEQRDILFQKMNEAGYEWDSRSKELRELSKSDETSELAGGGKCY